MQFIKRLLGCNIQTSNIMASGEIGVRPPLLNIIKRVVGYINSIRNRPNSTVNAAYDFESTNGINPNFCSFVDKFDLNCPNIYEKSKLELNRICQGSYDRFWWKKINESPKAVSYATFQRTVHYEKYLDQIKNPKHKKSLSRFRLSNHDLLIEKGRYMRPKLERHERECFNCEAEIEDEQHFIVKCPFYMEERQKRLDCCKNDSRNFDSLTDDQTFIFILTSENLPVTITLAKLIFLSLNLRQEFLSES